MKTATETVADVHNAGVFARSLDHMRAARGKAFQVRAAGFVGAVFAPHHAEDAEFSDVGVAAEDLLNAGEFVGGEAVLCGDLGGDFDFGVNQCSSGTRMWACRLPGRFRAEVKTTRSD